MLESLYLIGNVQIVTKPSGTYNTALKNHSLRKIHSLIIRNLILPLLYRRVSTYYASDVFKRLMIFIDGTDLFWICEPCGQYVEDCRKRNKAKKTEVKGLL